MENICSLVPFIELNKILIWYLILRGQETTDTIPATQESIDEINNCFEINEPQPHFIMKKICCCYGWHVVGYVKKLIITEQQLPQIYQAEKTERAAKKMEET